MQQQKAIGRYFTGDNKDINNIILPSLFLLDSENLSQTLLLFLLDYYLIPSNMKIKFIKAHLKKSSNLCPSRILPKYKYYPYTLLLPLVPQCSQSANLLSVSYALGSILGVGNTEVNKR